MPRKRKSGGRPKLPASEQRVRYTAFVLPATVPALDAAIQSHGSLGRLLDATFRTLSTPEP